MHLMIVIFTFILSVIALIWGSEVIITNAVRIGDSMKLNKTLTSALTIGIGTSMPELASSGALSLAGYTEAAVGNLIGSNVCNILLGLGIGTIISGMRIHWKKNAIALNAMLISSIFVVLVTLRISYWFPGVLLFITGIVYLKYMISDNKKDYHNQPSIKEIDKTVDEKTTLSSGQFVYSVLLFFIGLAVILGGADYFAESISDIVQITGINSGTIGIVLVSISTSMPELTVSFSAAKRNLHDVVLGNIIGSNVFNTTIGVTTCILLDKNFDLHSSRLHWDNILVIVLAILMIYAAKRSILLGKAFGITSIMTYILFILFNHFSV